MNNQKAYDDAVDDALLLQVQIKDLQASVDAFVAIGDSAVTIALSESSYTGTRQQINRVLSRIALARAAMFNEVSNQAIQDIIDLVMKEQQIYAINLRVSPLAREDLFKALHREYILGTKFQEWVSAAQASDYKSIRQQLRIGLTAGRTSLEVLQSIKGTQRQNYRDGVLVKAHRSVASLVTSATNMLVNWSRFQLMKRAGFTHWRFAAIVDDTTSAHTLAQEDTIYELDQGPRPPLHIGGRSLVVPTDPSAPPATTATRAEVRSRLT
jgi:hypothetical protein